MMAALEGTLAIPPVSKCIIGDLKVKSQEERETLPLHCRPDCTTANESR